MSWEFRNKSCFENVEMDCAMSLIEDELEMKIEFFQVAFVI